MIRQEDPGLSDSDSSTVARSVHQEDPKKKYQPQSKETKEPYAKIACGSKRTALASPTSSDEEPLSLAKQPKLSTKPELQVKGKGKARDIGTEYVPSPPHSPPLPDLDDSEAAQLRLAIQLSLMESQQGKAGASSTVMITTASESSVAPSIQYFPSSSSTGTSSQASGPPISGPRDSSILGKQHVVDPHVSRQLPPNAVHRLQGEYKYSTDDFDYFEEMLKVKGDLPSGFKQEWIPFKSLWESCGIYFDSRDPDVQASSSAALTDLRKLLTSSTPPAREFLKFYLVSAIFLLVHAGFSCNER